MLKKLSHKNLIVYEKYKGVKLTNEGNKMATILTRKHRLWETFLYEKLGFSWEEVHDVAEQLEHIRSEKLIERLDEYLDHPKFDPHGDPIPNSDGKFTMREQIILSSLGIGHTGQVIGVKIHDSTFLKYLNEMNLHPGTSIQLIEKIKFDGSCRVLIEDKNEILLSDKVSRNILLKKIAKS
jgi:DtxR family Mn-dependent transcriptional regulator